MGKLYLSQRFRERIVGILVSAAIIDELKEEEEKNKELFGSKAWGWLKQADTLITKALSDGLSETIGPEESYKIHALSKKFRVVLMRPSEPVPTDSIGIESKHLYDLAEHAIANHCTGCIIDPFMGCQLYQALEAVDMPHCNFKSGKCPYLQ